MIQINQTNELNKIKIYHVKIQKKFDYYLIEENEPFCLTHNLDSNYLINLNSNYFEILKNFNKKKIKIINKKYFFSINLTNVKKK